MNSCCSCCSTSGRDAVSLEVLLLVTRVGESSSQSVSLLLEGGGLSVVVRTTATDDNVLDDSIMMILKEGRAPNKIFH